MPPSHKSNKALSATEAADQIADEHRERKRKEIQKDEDTNQPSEYTCRNCGGHTFIVECSYVSKTTLKEFVSCECGEHDLAYERVRQISEQYQKWGYLDEEHHWTWKEDNREDILDDEEIESEVHCQACHDEWGSDPQASLETESVTKDDFLACDKEWYVKCEDCGHEIEFGWSHKDYSGRIWPCESSDFSPWKSWPEPRYNDDWERRGWVPSRFLKKKT